MASRRTRWIAAGSAGVLAAGGWLAYSLMAAQGHGILAQVPLNIQVQTPPAFLMALDDSGSMLWETLNNTRDGVYRFNGGFYTGNTPNGHDGSGQRYYYVFPNYGRDGQAALPQLDNFGFARSPDVNSSYFDPRETYPGWKTGSAAPGESNYLEIDPARAPLDPRPTGAYGKIDGALNLTEDSTLTAINGRNWRFRFASGMTLPVGTRIERGRCSLRGGATVREGNFDRVTRAGTTISNACDAALAFYPATFFLAEKLPADYGYTAEPVVITNPAGGRPGTLYKYEIKPGNFAAGKYAPAMQNFANWFSLYRTRRESLIGAATNALYDTTNLRVGWFRINGRTNVKMYDMTNEAEKVTLLREITSQMRANGSTPNRSAAQYLGQQFKRTGEDAPVQLSCQKNAGMLFTDGYINETSNRTLMKTLVAPFYNNSLVPGMENNSVPVPKECSVADPDPSLDCNTHLHMNFYGVTLGTLGQEFGVKYLQDPNRPWVLTPDPYVTRPSFPTTTQDNNPRAVDELWNAVYDTHGEMINATRPAEITAAMRRIISNVAQGSTPSGTRSLTGARIGVGSLSVEPFYEAANNGTDWYSKLQAYKLGVDPDTRQVVASEAWEASASMPPAASRRVYYWRNGEAVEFNSTNVGLDDLCSKSGSLYPGMLICSENEITTLAGDAATAVNYLRGSTAEEKQNGGKLRDRTTVLGDIISSTPVLSSPLDDYGYRGLPGAMGTSYGTYLTTKRNNRRYMVYAAANDGMLHGFDGGMAADGELDGNGGRELFAYIPSTSIGHMGNLLLPNDPDNENTQRFQHRYYVDGPIAVGDTYGASGWTTSLVGTAGAGGRSVFALDMSNPGRFGDTDTLLWDINDLDATLDEAVRNNIGYVLGKPVIVPMKNRDGTVGFKAIFGNGYESASGKAVLFVVDMLAGRQPNIRMIEAVEAGSNLPAGSNGLGNIVVVDRWGGAAQNERVRDGLADTVYAADKRGALWKFDLRSDTAPSVPLFTTNTHVDPADRQTYRQPITGGMAATTGPSGGVMLIFGTGSFSYIGDENDAAQQALYGVNDTNNGQPATALTSANLVPYTVRGGDEARTLERGTPPANNGGWTVVLPYKERFVGNPRIVSGLAFMPTYVPSESAGCSVDGSNWLFGLQASTGAAGLSQVKYGDGSSPGDGTAGVKLDTGGNAPVRDVTASVVPRLGAQPDDGSDDPPPPPPDACTMQIDVAGADPMLLPYPCGRQSWRQVQ